MMLGRKKNIKGFQPMVEQYLENTHSLEVNMHLHIN